MGEAKIKLAFVLEVEVEEKKEISLITSIYRHGKYIPEKILRILFIVSPLLEHLLFCRKLLIDWENPLAAFAVNLVFYFIWWKVLALFQFYTQNFKLFFSLGTHSLGDPVHVLVESHEEIFRVSSEQKVLQ